VWSQQVTRQVTRDLAINIITSILRLYGKSQSKSCIAHKNGYLSDVAHKPSSSKTKHLRSILDVAGVCLHEKQHQAFVLSISDSPHETPGISLFISQNCTANCGRPPPKYLCLSCAHLRTVPEDLNRIRLSYDGAEREDSSPNIHLFAFL
jgi:hypothetical protein